MDFILNIGLKVGTSGNIPVELVKDMLWNADLSVKTERVVQSDTEPTLVVEVSSMNGPTLTLALLNRLSSDLGQDCVAVYRPKTQSGALIGPKAAAWGSFNPEFFILPDGTRLSQPSSQAA